MSVWTFGPFFRLITKEWVGISVLIMSVRFRHKPMKLGLYVGHTLLIQIINFVFIVISKITSVWNTVGRLITIVLFANTIILST